VFDVQCGHGALLCERFWCDHHARYALGLHLSQVSGVLERTCLGVWPVLA
jgi:hypothetical protein